MSSPSPTIAAIDLFCGAGGLSLGLKQAGIDVVAGIDLDPACQYPYEQNLKAQFILKDVGDVKGVDLQALWPEGKLRLLAGCAPCQPFSSHRRGADTRDEENWDLLSHFARLVEESLPEFVTMENVTRLGKMPVFENFVAKLEELDYEVDFGTLYGPEFGLPQERRRLVLMASRKGNVSLPKGNKDKSKFKTVKQTISRLPKLEHGESDPKDLLHTARRLTPLNLRRMKASAPGGTWRDWPVELLAPCHTRSSGASFQAFYGRMTWDAPSPTITTQSFNFGTGRFGHPEQDRSLTLREAAMLQGFPRSYRFVKGKEKPSMQAVGRLIGNAVPPAFGRAVGETFLKMLEAQQATDEASRAHQ
ncbi:site-specific DNA methylase [Microbacterium testaceum StLB037]|uniref:DNA (cytosine-5-)-methyltransferase n=1 Tax=Microbacterium testaceum (strain StLB037) TaxID=979556 RepID=E8N9G2_MICTS|nr:DNA cytosine methyltransferase [Microbacterium testaceum]BAJ73209.1 site-specific DNA methylase [Microbacterium testaceum StLB037]